MESIIAKELRKFASENNLIPDIQHGFTAGKSVITNLLCCLNDWTRSVDLNLPVDVLYLDFARAFDKVPINRLLFKLEHLGIRGKLLRWFENYLTNRYFCVRVGDSLSGNVKVLGGVPQGSVLGPLLFLLYVADLPTHLSSTVSMFADDTKLYANPLTNYDHLTKDLQALNAWCSEWLLPLNCDKYTVLHLGKNNPMLSYNIAGVPLTVVDYHNDLGIIISSDLKWERHIVSITKKANSMLFLISRSFCNPTPSTAAKLIRMYVRPILEFAAPSWSPYFAKDINTLERVQRRATKLAPAIRHRPYEERLSVMKLPSLYRLFAKLRHSF